MRDAETAAVRLSDYTPPPYHIDEIALVFMLDPEQTIVAASSHVRRTSPAAAPLELNGERLDLQSIAIDGEPLAAVIYTDIATDGMMGGPNVAAMAAMQAAVRVPVIASGGVTTATDVARLAEAGLAGCIIGRALYEGTLALADALRVSQTPLTK